VRAETPLDDLQWGIERYAEALTQAIGKAVPVRVDVRKKENIDWIARYRESIRPVEVAGFYVHPTWEPPKKDRRNIRIDPALAFGSGHHETTASCLEAVAQCVTPGQRVLDVGCGSGILGIAAAMLGAKADACDTDPLAVENAAKNFELNGQTPERLWEGSAAMTDKTYDTVLANIVADVLVMIAKDLKARVRPGGTLVLSGILDKNEKRVEAAFADLDLIDTIAKNEWRTKIYRKQG
jgi:ribosomal protein L11 methyltransferase